MKKTTLNNFISKKVLNKFNFIILLLVVIVFALVRNVISLSDNTKENESLVKTNTELENTTLDIENSNFTEILTCFSDETKSQSCLDAFMKEFAEGKDTKTVLSEIEYYRSINTEVENQCHPIVHAIGRLTFEKYGNVGDAFEQCDQTCHSGCYHGVMERLFFGDEEIKDTTQHLEYNDFVSKIPGICDANKFKDPSNAVIFQCLHGVGHAILYSMDYDLFGALKVCDLLKTDYEKSSCYGGVYMENVTAFDKSKRVISKEDQHYPCNASEDHFRYQCYLMQTSVMLDNGLTQAQMADECKNAGNYVYPCFISLGRDTSNSVRLGQVEHARSVCEDLSIGNERGCIDGLVYALIDNTWDAKFAYQYCEALTTESNKQICYTDANNYLGYSYAFGTEALNEQCDKFAPNENAYCKEMVVTD